MQVHKVDGFCNNIVLCSALNWMLVLELLHELSELALLAAADLSKITRCVSMSQAKQAAVRRLSLENAQDALRTSVDADPALSSPLEQQANTLATRDSKNIVHSMLATKTTKSMVATITATSTTQMLKLSYL